MFDIDTKQQIYEHFQKKHKQQNTETVTAFYIKYQTQIRKLITRKIWMEDESLQLNEVSFFEQNSNRTFPYKQHYYSNKKTPTTKHSPWTRLTERRSLQKGSCKIRQVQVQHPQLLTL